MENLQISCDIRAGMFDETYANVFGWFPSRWNRWISIWRRSIIYLTKIARWWQYKRIRNKNSRWNNVHNSHEVHENCSDERTGITSSVELNFAAQHEGTEFGSSRTQFLWFRKHGKSKSPLFIWSTVNLCETIFRWICINSIFNCGRDMKRRFVIMRMEFCWIAT